MLVEVEDKCKLRTAGWFSDGCEGDGVNLTADGRGKGASFRYAILPVCMQQNKYFSLVLEGTRGRCIRKSPHLQCSFQYLHREET